MAKMNSEKSAAVIKRMKFILESDNGPQYSSSEFAKFSKGYGFVYSISNPKHPQSNGEAERKVQTVKALLKKTR